VVSPGVNDDDDGAAQKQRAHGGRRRRAAHCSTPHLDRSPNTCHARSASSEEAREGVGAAGTVAFHRGAAQRGEVGRAAAVLWGREEEQGRALGIRCCARAGAWWREMLRRRKESWAQGGRGPAAWIFWAPAISCVMARPSWERGVAVLC
jgi:hypothetical protein